MQGSGKPTVNLDETAGLGPTVVLTVAGSDSGGGAGIQADLKTFQQFSVFGTSVVTATTAQNTLGVHDVHVIPAAHVDAQLASVASDLAPKTLKSGMLATAEIAEVLARAIDRFGWDGYVLDPVMVSTSGARLLDPDAEAAVREWLVPRATLVTPNVPEAEVLTGRTLASAEDLAAAGADLLAMGARAALVKGGHLSGTTDVVDVLVTGERSVEVRSPRIDSPHTHGTGCTLSAAVAAGLGRGWPLEDAVRIAIQYVGAAIANAPGLGSGHGPLDHFGDPGLVD